MSLLDHFRKKNPDGTSSHGAGVFIIVMLVLIAGGCWVFRDHIFGRTAPAPTQTRADVARKLKVDKMADAAENVGRKSPAIENVREAPRSDRGSGLDTAPDITQSKPGDTGQSSTVSALDTINAAMALKEPGQSSAQGGANGQPGGANGYGDGHQELDEGGSIRVSRQNPDELSPTFVHEPDANSSQKLAVPVISKLVYHPTEDPVSFEKAAVEAIRPAHHTKIFMPRGEKLTVCLLTTVETGKIASFIELGVMKDAYFDGHLVMPFGARLVGAASEAGVRDRIQISASSVRFMKDIPELAFRGIAIDPDGAVGVRAYFIPPPTLVQLAPYVDQFLTAFSAYEATNQITSVSLGAASVQLNPGAEARAAGLTASANALNDFTAAQLKTLQNRYEAHLTLPIGTEFTIQLTSDFNADPLYEPGGVLAVGPANEPLPVRPSGIDPFPSAPSGGTVTAGSPESKAASQVATAAQEVPPAAQRAVGTVAPAASNGGQSAPDFFPQPAADTPGNK